MSQRKYYVRPELFRKEYLKCRDEDKCSDKLIGYFGLIADKFIQGSKTRNMDDFEKDCCVSYATSEAYIKWKSFDIQRSDNIFAFFTQMIKNDIYYHFNTCFKRKHISIDQFIENMNDD